MENISELDLYKEAYGMAVAGTTNYDYFLWKARKKLNLKNVLDDEERKYLGEVIKPFKKKIVSIEKHLWGPDAKYSFISIRLKSIKDYPSYECVSFPYFKTDKMYKGMAVKKAYTLKDLNLE